MRNRTIKALNIKILKLAVSKTVKFRNAKNKRVILGAVLRVREQGEVDN